jgi:hypothetical protein
MLGALRARTIPLTRHRDRVPNNEGGPTGPPSLQQNSGQRYGLTVVVAVAVLFAVFGSVGDAAETVTVFVMVPFWVGLTTMVAVSVAPFANVLQVQVTVIFDRVHVPPWVALAEPKPVLLGSVSINVTVLAVSGPLFVTGIV